jgi:hypothetical protein
MNIQYTLSDDLIDEITIDSLINVYQQTSKNITESESTYDWGDLKDAVALKANLVGVLEYFTTAETRKEKGVDF